MSRPVTDRVTLLCQERSDPSETEAASPSEDNDTDIALYPLSVRSMFHTTSLLRYPRQSIDFEKQLETIIRSRLLYLHAELNNARYHGHHGFIASSVPSPHLFPSNRP